MWETDFNKQRDGCFPKLCNIFIPMPAWIEEDRDRRNFLWEGNKEKSNSI